MSDRLLQNVKFIQALAPDADRFANDPATDIISMKNHKHCTFILHIGVGAAGTTVLTVESCDDTDPTTATAVAFRYKIVSSGDTEGDTTAASSSGFTTTAGSNQLYIVEVDDDMLSGTDSYVRLQTTEDDSTAVDAGILAILTGSNFAGNDMPTAIV